MQLGSWCLIMVFISCKCLPHMLVWSLGWHLTHSKSIPCSISEVQAFLSYGHPLEPHLPDKRGLTVLFCYPNCKLQLVSHLGILGVSCTYFFTGHFFTVYLVFFLEHGIPTSIFVADIKITDNTIHFAEGENDSKIFRGNKQYQKRIPHF